MDEIQKAETVIIAVVQNHIFSDEICIVKSAQDSNVEEHRKQHIINKSNLSRLDPYLDTDGILRVGGRIRKARLPGIRHPVILPKSSHVTKLILLHFHRQTGHSGRGITSNGIRTAGYWIISGLSSVAKYIWNCVTCRKLRGPVLQQKMGNLPMDRLEPTEPFTYSAVDVFGPFFVKQGRSDVKRYGTLFTCLCSRTVHIEIANSLSTDSFKNAYRRFVCRRRPVRMLRSDRGTNFVGANSELLNPVSQLNEEKIRQNLMKDNCDWVIFNMNVPHASHMGGIWERMIRSVRSILAGLLKENGHQLDDELLRTLMVEAEAIVNSRPLTYTDSTSSDAPEPLCPNNLLLMKSKIVTPPPGEFMKEDLYCRRRWRRVQYLANIFWSRWKAEYLLILQQRNKWAHPKRNLAKGDIVLMVIDNETRSQWPMARVLETFPGDDGFVRKVKVKSGQSTYERPIHKLVLLITGDNPDKEPH